MGSSTPVGALSLGQLQQMIASTVHSAIASHLHGMGASRMSGCPRPDEDEEHELGATMAATVLEDTTPPHTPPVRSASRPAGFAMSRTGSQHPSFGGLSYEEEEEESLHPDLDFDLKNQASEGYLEAHLVEELRDTIASAASEAQSTARQR